MNTNTLMSDFEDLSIVSYKDYEYLKAFQLLNLQDIPSEYRIRKVHNKLFINETSYNLEDISISSFINLILDEVQGIQAYRYEENPVGYLNTSSLFLTDFDTLKVIQYSFSKDILIDYWFDEYTDEFNSKFNIKNFKILNQSNIEVPFNKNGNKILIKSKNQQEFKVFCTYQATDLKINLMQEFPISNVSQLFSMSKDIY